MEDKNFDIKAKSLIESVYSQIELSDKNYEAEIEYSNEVLKIEISGKIFILNKQTPAREIWLASPVSGPYHFFEDNHEWVDSKRNNLKRILSEEISSLITSKVEIK